MQLDRKIMKHSLSFQIPSLDPVLAFDRLVELLPIQQQWRSSLSTRDSSYL